jgi:hypothetical protein
MELYLEDIDMMPGSRLHWDLPRDVEAPSSRGRPHGVHRSVGVLITIGPSSHADNDQIERVCDTPQQVVEVIRAFSNLTLIYINCHSIDAQGRSDARERLGVCGIRLGGARIYERDLPLFGQIRSSFPLLRMTEPLTLGIVHAAHAYVPASSGTPTGRSLVTFGMLNQRFWDGAPSPAPMTSPAPVEFRITAEGFNATSHSFVPRIVMRSCSIGQNQPFCQLLADTAETWVFAPTVDQWASQTEATPWRLHGPVRVFMPACVAYLQDSASRRDLSPFRQRLGQQMIATGSGRGVGRRRGPTGYA